MIIPETVLYSLDTSALVTAWGRNYPPDVFAPVWDHMDTLIRNGVVRASREVLTELEKQDDELCHWCKVREDDLFIDLVEELQDAVTALLAKYPKIVAAGKGRNRADPFVIALATLAKPTPLIIVTEESPLNGSPKRPNIPFICKNEGLASHPLITLLRNTGLKLH
jgi:hypothetical protein